MLLLLVDAIEREPCAARGGSHALERLVLVIARRHHRSRAFGWSVVAFRSSNQLGLIDLSGVVVAPRPGRGSQGTSSAGGERRRSAMCGNRMHGRAAARWKRGSPVGPLRVPGRELRDATHDDLIGTQPTDQPQPRQRSTPPGASGQPRRRRRRAGRRHQDPRCAHRGLTVGMAPEEPLVRASLARAGAPGRSLGPRRCGRWGPRRQGPSPATRRRHRRRPAAHRLMPRTRTGPCP